MKPQLSITLSLGTIAVLLLMTVLPTGTESTTAGWVGYGIIIGLLLSVTIRATSTLLYQRSYKRTRKAYYNRSR